jgi:thymidylate synthase ThyX
VLDVLSDNTYAKVIADSIAPRTHDRVTTMEVCLPRFMLPEFNTHRVFSRNSASSRAIPVAKMVKRLRESPAIPVEWPAEQRGMQGGEALSEEAATIARHHWLQARDEAIERVLELWELGLHKSVSNRLIEPFAMHTIVVTATAWENFFIQRCSPLAQPEIRVAAVLMRDAYDASEPQVLAEGEWHTPYMDPETMEEIEEHWPTATKISAARCARVSYLTQDGRRDIAQDLELYQRLTSAQPAHWSPLEHVATPDRYNRQVEDHRFVDMDGRTRHASTHHLPKAGNLLGWRSLRLEVESYRGERTFA